MNNHSNSPPTVKKVIEICLISARGLPRQTLFKNQWYAIGWINQSDKYCTTIDTSGTTNPLWKTKFTTVISTTLESKLEDVVLNVEVYSREPVFLREKLQCTASINLKEFLCKEGIEHVGSFQLRKKNGKAFGFIDVSVRVSDENEGLRSSSFVGAEEGFNLRDNNGIDLATEQMQAYTGGEAELPIHPPSAHPYSHPVPNPRPYSHPSIDMPSYPPATNPSYPPPQPYNVGYGPYLPPQANTQSTSYMNMPSSSAGAGRGVGPGFGVGLGAGALAAGAVIYGGDLMSGFELPTVMSNPSITMSIDPPF